MIDLTESDCNQIFEILSRRILAKENNIPVVNIGSFEKDLWGNLRGDLMGSFEDMWNIVMDEIRRKL